MNWIIPNAEENHDAMTTAWYGQTGFNNRPDRPELQEEEDEEGMVKTVKYLESLIDACCNKGIPPNRIVLGGFSQGCAMGLLTDLISQKYSGRLAGIVGLMGYLPLSSGYRIQELRAHAGLPPTMGEVSMFLARGQKDQLIPRRIWSQTTKKLEDLGYEKSGIELHEYEGVGHSITGTMLKELCQWLERVVPKLED